MDNNIGKKLDGRYELLELIGVGGMADIYRAKDIQEDRMVAVKILKTEYAGSEEFLRRFRNESKAIALLSHPNIVKIYDVGFTDKVQFIVMEYVDGITLADYIEQQGVLKWRDAVHFTVQVLKALQHAHDRGIVHRDIKSSNIMLLRDGTIKVMDFGIARFNRENNKTMSEKTIGSVHYISPEQARGDMTDERSDIYSVGVALYEMLTGKKPFDGDTPVAIALMHMQTEPKKPTDINETIPEGLEQIVLKAMQKEPNARYQTALEMITDLEEFKKNPGMVFDYKYNSADGTPKFSGVNPLTEQTEPRKRKAVDEPDEPVKIDDIDDLDDEEIEERRSPLIPILFGVGAAFVIVAVFLILKLVSDRLGGDVNMSAVGNVASEYGIVINNGELTMPNFIGKDWEEVSKAFPNDDILNLVPQEEWSEEPQGRIFGQEFPQGRKVKQGASVRINVSKGKRQVEIEDMSNRSAESAKKQLEKSGFKVHITKAESDTVAKDYVIRTLPEAHTMAEVGSSVNLVVSLGPDDKPFIVPKLIDMKQEEATKKCEELGLKVKVETKDSLTEKGTVINQSIAENSMASNGDEITLTVSTGEMPDIEKEVTITLPQNISGDFTFKYYVDGVLDNSATETRDVGSAASKTLKYTIIGKDDETHELMVKVNCVATGKEDTYLTVSIEFKDGKGSVLSDTENKNSKVFEELAYVEPEPEPEPSEPEPSEPESKPESTKPVSSEKPVQSAEPTVSSTPDEPMPSTSNPTEPMPNEQGDNQQGDNEQDNSEPESNIET